MNLGGVARLAHQRIEGERHAELGRELRGRPCFPQAAGEPDALDLGAILGRPLDRGQWTLHPLILHRAVQQLDASDDDRQQVVEVVGGAAGQLAQRAQRAVKISLVLDQLARNEELGVDPAELTAYVTRQAEQMGVSPDQLAQQLADNNQINVAAAEVLRGKAMNLIAERVKVTDESGNPVDIATALNTPLTPAGDAADVDAADQEAVLAATETDEIDEAGDADTKA